ncbi:MAG TPA: adenosylcobinamide-GDP ribazoletransferase [Polyangiaceae bacterium]
MKWRRSLRRGSCERGRGRMLTAWQAWRSAVAFLTRVPVGSSAIDANAQSWAPACFPLVGLALGAVTYAALGLARPLGAPAAATLATALAVWLTGAFHEDGLADSADGLLGAVSRERALEIMKDSRIGTYGAAALSLVLMLRVALLSALGAMTALACLMSVSLARVGPVWLMTHLNHAAPNQSKNKDLTSVPRSRAYCATLLMLAASAVMLTAVPSAATRIGAAWLIEAIVILYVGRLARRRLGGITGDLLGASEQLGEVTILMVFAAHV